MILSALGEPPSSLVAAAVDDGYFVALRDGTDLRAIVFQWREGGLFPARRWRTSIPGDPFLFAAREITEQPSMLFLRECQTAPAARCVGVITPFAEPEGAGAVRELPLPGRARGLRVDADEGRVHVAVAPEEGLPLVHSFFLSEAGQIAGSTHRIEASPVEHEGPAELLALSSRGAAWTLIFRVGSIEDPRGGTLLATREGVFELEPLHHAAMVDVLVPHPEDDTLLALATYEFHRPRVVRFDRRGRLRMAPRTVDHRERLGSPFPVRPRARLAASDGGLHLHLSTWGGDALGAPLVVVGSEEERRGRATMVAQDDRIAIFFALYAGEGSTLRAALYRCPPGPP